MHVLLGGHVSGLLLTIISFSSFAWFSVHIGASERGGAPEASMVTVFAGAVALWAVYMLARQLLRRVDALRLLERGMVTYGTLIEKRELPTSGDDPPKVLLRFSFDGQNGETHVVEVETHSPGRLEDDPREQLVYPPGRPQEAVMIDALPGQPRIREDNTISVADHKPGVVLGMLLVAVAALVNLVGAYLYVR
jgi:hypothetical protein